MEVVADCDFAGWLYKQGSLIKNWKRRFFTLSGNLLTYYDTSVITPEVKEKGNLRVITVELLHEKNNALLIHGSGGRILKVYAESTENCTDWYKMLRAITTGSGPAMVSGSRPSLSAASSYRGSFCSSESNDFGDEINYNTNAEDHVAISHCGWLSKEGSRVKSWKRRYFSLRGRNLAYFSTANTGGSCKGKGYVTGVDLLASKPFSLKITFEGGRILHISADSQADMETWREALTLAVEGITAGNTPSNFSSLTESRLEAMPRRSSIGAGTAGFNTRSSLPACNVSSMVKENNSKFSKSVGGFGDYLDSQQSFLSTVDDDVDNKSNSIQNQKPRSPLHLEKQAIEENDDSDGDWI